MRFSTGTRHGRCVLIDFGACRLRHPDETDEEWRRAKQDQDEEGAIGHVVQKLINSRSDCIKWEYRPSNHWDRVLSVSEQKAYEEEEGWGLYDHRSKATKHI